MKKPMQPDQGFIIDSDHLFKIAKDGYQKASQGSEIHQQNDAIVAIVFSALALEAFINELLFIAKMEKRSGSSEDWLDKLIEAIEEPSTDGIPAKKPNGWIKCFNKFLNTFKLELRFIPVAKWKSTREKFMLVSEALGSQFDKGSSLYQDFADLFKLRDCFVHLKPEDLIEPDEDKIYEYVGRKLIKKLRSKGIFQQYTSVQSITLLVSNAKAAKWACETTSKMVIEILDKLDQTATSDFTTDNKVLALYRETFQPPT
jgi:hypothetical protein